MPANAQASTGTFTLTVTGTGFDPLGATIVVDGTDLAIGVVSGTSVTGTFDTSAFNPGVLSVLVRNRDGTLSNSLPFTLLPAPMSLTAISPAIVAIDSGTRTITATGAGFTATDVIVMDGVTVLATTFVSATQLTFQIDTTTETARNAQIRVRSGGGATSTPQTLELVVPTWTRTASTYPSWTALIATGMTWYQVARTP